MRLVDHHCHLDFPQFEDDRAGLIARAVSAGVEIMVTISTRVAQFEKLLAIAESNSRVFCSVGTHPHYADEEPHVTAHDLVRLSEHPKVVAIGEAGLDYHYQRSSREGQAAGFRRHIDAARRTGLPLEIHARDADEDTLAILEDEHAKGAFPAILHCYTGGQTLAARAVELGLLVSFTGVVTYKSAANVMAIAADIPLDAILVETDAPYLAPIPHRGQTNEPAFVVHTAEAIANARGISVEALAEATTQNFFRTFKKVPRTVVGDEVTA
ncbi:MAG: TatD family hydrolase [Pseudomonadota bacterium]